MTDVSLSTTSAVTPQAGDLIPVVRNGAWVNADGAVLVNAASSATAAANSATSAAQEVEQSLTTISSGVSSAQETADAALGAVQSGGFVTETSLETTLGGYATTSGVTSEIESATSGLVSSGTSGTNIGANPVTYGGQTVSLNTALEQASQTGGDGSGGSGALSPATATALGGVMVPAGGNLSVDTKGNLSAAGLVVAGNTSGSTDIAGQKITVNGAVTTTGAAIEAAAKTGGGTGGSAATFSTGDFFQPTGLVTDTAVKTPLAPITLSASSSLSGPAGRLIVVDPTKTRRNPWLGFGACGTGAAIYAIMTQMTKSQRTAYFTTLTQTCGWRLFRMTCGVSDFDYRPDFSYDENGGVADLTMANFSIAPDLQYVIPFWQELLAVCPDVDLVVSMWSPPSWMKSPATIRGGYFQGTTANFQALALYWQKYLSALARYGIFPRYLCIQNEIQETDTAYAKTGWVVSDMTTAAGYITSALRAVGLNTRIISADTSWGPAAQKQIVLNNFSGVNAKFFAGVGYHGYTGHPTQEATDIAQYVGDGIVIGTEYMFGSQYTLDAQMRTLLGDYIFGQMAYGAVGTMQWNLALNQQGGPYLGDPNATTGGYGAVTQVKSDGTWSLEPDGYILAQLGQVFRRGDYPCYCVSPALGYNATDLVAGCVVGEDGHRGVGIWNPTSSPLIATVLDAQTGTAFSVSVAANSLFSGSWSPADIVEAGSTLAAPSAPTLGTPGNSTAGYPTLPISAPANIGSTSVGAFNIYAVNGSTQTLIGRAAGSDTLFTDTSLSSGSRNYVATALGGGGESPISNQVTGTFFAPAVTATAYTLTGSASLTTGTATTYTVTPNAAIGSTAVVVTPTSTVAGSFSPTTVTLAAGSDAAATFTFTPSASGTGTLSATNNGGLTDPSALSVTAAAATVPFTTYSLAASPASVVVGGASKLTVTPGDGAANTSDIVVTLSDGDAGGSFSPETLTFSAGSTAAQSSTYTAPTTAKTVALSATNNGSLTNPSAVSLTVTTEPVVGASYLAATSSGSGATAGSAKLITGNVAEIFADIDLDSYSNTTNNSLIIGNYPTTGASKSNSQVNLLISTGGTVSVQAYDSGGTYCHNTSALPTGISGRVKLHSVMNIDTANSYTDTLGNVIETGGMQISLSTDGGKTYSVLPTVSSSNVSHNGINQPSAPNAMAVGHLAENAGKIYSVVIYDGTGTAIWNPDFTTQTAGATTFTDGAGNTWAVDSGAAIASA
ncbi:hypothetical protein [Acetobacter sicerae]|uniref:hypothetical protein n=1 Tax=Acetobacter sicerae TaxID=85325 RepID=UPI00156BD02E|nr:hypothetical protein [Acetobacter sicerae]NHN93460.1 hypothetical protein [Acetobacter sicerae]